MEIPTIPKLIPDEPSKLINIKLDEIVIKKEEYDLMRKQIEDYKIKEEINHRNRNRTFEENNALKTELETISKENNSLKNGIIKFVKMLGG